MTTGERKDLLTTTTATVDATTPYSAVGDYAGTELEGGGGGVSL